MSRTTDRKTFVKPDDPCGTLRVVLPSATYFTYPLYDGEFLTLKWGPIWPDCKLPLITHLIHIVKELDAAEGNFVGSFSWNNIRFYVYHQFSD